MSQNTSEDDEKGIECEVRFHGASSRITGREHIRLILCRGSTLKDLILHLKKKWPDLIRLIESNTFFITLNGKVLNEGDLEIELRSSDVVSIIPFVAGG